MSRLKKIILFAVLLLIAFLLYSYLSDTNDVSDSLIAGNSPTDLSVGQDFIVLLAKLKTIKLDENLFRGAAFLSLEDSTVTIAPQPVGRHNPFAPLGGPEGF